MSDWGYGAERKRAHEDPSLRGVYDTVRLVFLAVIGVAIVGGGTVRLGLSRIEDGSAGVSDWLKVAGVAVLSALAYLVIVAWLRSLVGAGRGPRGVPFAAPRGVYPLDQMGRVEASTIGRAVIDDVEVRIYRLKIGQQAWFARVSRKYDVAIAKTGHLSPFTQVWPETVVDKALEAVGLPDTDLESAEFNRRWRVYAKDLGESYHLFHPKLVEFFIGDVPRAVFSIAPGAVVVAAPRRAADPAAMARAAAGVASHLPSAGAGEAPPLLTWQGGQRAEEGAWRLVSAVAVSTLLAAGAFVGGVAWRSGTYDDQGGVRDDQSSFVLIGTAAALPVLTFVIPTVLGWIGSRLASFGTRAWRRT